MSSTFENLGIGRLTNDERLELIGEIWESLTPIDQLKIPDCHREELNRRLAASETGTVQGAPWEEVRARLRGET